MWHLRRVVAAAVCWMESARPFLLAPLTTTTHSTLTMKRTRVFGGRWDPPPDKNDRALEDLMRATKAVEDDNLLPDSLVVTGAAGIEWGTDLSFKGVYVRDVEPGSPSAVAGVEKGDQLVAVNGTQAFDRTFDQVMAMRAADVKFEFFRGSRTQLLESFGLRRETATDVTVTVLDESSGRVLTEIKAARGANLRELLVGAGMDVYRGSTKYLNCRGKQLCGTCIVDVRDGADQTNRKSNDEFATLNLQNTQPSCRLSCVTFVYGDVQVSLQPDRSGYFGSATSGSAWA